jgi:hypothetical protein
MKPEADQILNHSALQLLMNVAPLLAGGYPQGTVSLVSLLMMMVAQEYERGADIRATENAEMRTLFAELGAFVNDGELATKILAASATQDHSLRVSALNEANGALRRLLIDLQAHAELLPGAEARNAERRIWQVLKASAERRLVRAPG